MEQSHHIDEALERGYNVRAARSDYDALADGWNERSRSFRSRADAHLNVPYGPAERQRLDIFAGAAGEPTLIYLHGGYWQRGDKSMYSFVAEPFVNQRVNVVVMNYTLCPATTVPGITDEIRGALVWLYEHGDAYGLARERLNVCGHSAGGHLTAMMLATRWPDRRRDLPVDLVKSAIPISGLYDLDPLRRTSINEAAGIDVDAARHCSPGLLDPACDAPVLAVVGGAETPAFHEQTETFVERWSAAGGRVEHYVEPGVDHFDIVSRLADAGSELFNKTLDWIV